MDRQSSEANNTSFTEIYERNIDMVYRLCFILLKNTADADDAVQSIFLKLYKHSKPFHDREHERAWLIVTTKNTCKDILKSWWRSRRVDLDNLPEKTHWDHDDQQKDILEQLLWLPEKYRTVMYLYYIEDYSIREMSKLLNRKESTIQTQLSKGRSSLKAEWGGMQIDREPIQGSISTTRAKSRT